MELIEHCAEKQHAIAFWLYFTQKHMHENDITERGRK